MAGLMAKIRKWLGVFLERFTDPAVHARAT
jgi:hypothetical protein